MTEDSRAESTVNAATERRVGHSWEDVPVAAERYERDLVPALFEPWVGVLIDIAGVGPGDRVLDLACGTGVVARHAARLVGVGGHVCGLDVNEDMLAIARRTGHDIEWRQDDASRTGLPDSSFDVVFCQQGLQFFPDRPAGLREIHRLLAPGGRAVIATWCAADDGATAYAPIAAAFQRHRPDDSDLTRFIAAIFGLSEGAEVVGLAEAAGFDDVRVERRTATVRFPSAEAWVEAFLGAAPVPSVARLAPATRAAIITDAAAALERYTGPTGLVFQLHSNIVLCTGGPRKRT